MNEAPVVVKVGGSLFDLPGLGKRLASFLSVLEQREIILVAGGGPAAQFVRILNRDHRLGEEASHWLAVRSLSLTAHVLAAMLPSAAVVDSLSERRPLWTSGMWPILDLFAFAKIDDARPGALPHSWDVTSDSLAARVAEVSGARELILLKSVTLSSPADWTDASRQGHVDAHFPRMTARGVTARVINLREWQPRSAHREDLPAV
jgi:aspartokinase-like uncharacterized kinase